MTLDARVSIGVLASLVGATDLSIPAAPLDYRKDKAMLNGTGTGQVDKIFADTRTVNASSTDTLDLAGGSLTDPLGAALTFVKLKGIVVVAADGNANNVVVTRPAANGVPVFSAAGDACPVLPGGYFVWTAPGAGITVTAGTGDLLDIVNGAGGTSVTYDVILLGTSA